MKCFFYYLIVVSNKNSSNCPLTVSRCECFRHHWTNVENIFLYISISHGIGITVLTEGIWSAVVMNRCEGNWKTSGLLLIFSAFLASYFCRPWGDLNVAWSQRPVNQMSIDLAGLADKRVHGRRQRQTVRHKRPTCKGPMKRHWSTSNKTRPGCLHAFCFIWFSFWLYSWCATLQI